MLQKTNSQEYKDGSPSAAPSREIETSKKWLHDYLLGQDEDDFRNRFFKKVDSIAELEAQRVVKKQQAAAKAAIANSTPQFTARGRACPIDEASLSQLLPETTGHITKYSSQEGIDRWMARSFDDCRRDYIHTLMDRRMFGKMASREQKSTSIPLTQLSSSTGTIPSSAPLTLARCKVWPR
jgi:hypothetical protein